MNLFEKKKTNETMGTVVCKQFTSADEDGRLICEKNDTNPIPPLRSQNLRGGSINEKRICELQISYVESYDEGWWSVEVSNTETGSNNSTFQLQTTRQD